MSAYQCEACSGRGMYPSRAAHDARLTHPAIRRIHRAWALMQGAKS